MSEPIPASLDTETWITGKRTAIVERISVDCLSTVNGKPLRFTIVRLEPDLSRRPTRQVRVT